MFLLVGLTGGIGTGKSSVSRILRSRNYSIIDADEVAKQVVEPGKKAYKKMRAEFGDEYFDDANGGMLDREKMGLLVFSDRKARQKMDSITHPEIAKAIFWEILCQFIKFQRIVFLDIPLLFESKMDKFMQILVVVTCNEETQIQRIIQRDGILEEEAKRRIDAQMPTEEKVRRADFVIRNDGNPQQLEEEVNRVLCSLESKWRKLALRICAFFLLLILTFYFTKSFLWN